MTICVWFTERIHVYATCSVMWSYVWNTILSVEYQSKHGLQHSLNDDRENMRENNCPFRRMNRTHTLLLLLLKHSLFTSIQQYIYIFRCMYAVVMEGHQCQMYIYFVLGLALCVHATHERAHTRSTSCCFFFFSFSNMRW